MRFEVRFVNGGWVVFDSHRYEALRPCGTLKECQERVQELESRPRRKR